MRPSVAKFEKSFRTPASVLKSEFIARNFCQAVTYTKGCFRYQNKIILFNSLTNSKTNIHLLEPMVHLQGK